jgi:hypothetical protein
MSDENPLTLQEQHAVNKLVEAWHTFRTLEVLHPSHESDFADAIHTCQRIVMCRPVARVYKEERES